MEYSIVDRRYKPLCRILVFVSLMMIGCILITGCGAASTATTGATTAATVVAGSETVTATGVGTATAGSATTTAATPETGTTTASTASSAATTGAQTPSSGGQPATVQPEDKLSSRLKILSDPSISSQDAAAQAKAVSLPASGRGSLRRNAQGELLVLIRLTDTSKTNVDALRKAGATVTNTSETYRTVTAYVRPDHLKAVAAVPAVENISEQLSP